MGVTAIVLALGPSPGTATGATTLAALPGPVPVSQSDPDGALPVQPTGGNGCIIGLNCGCLHNCHKSHPHPPNVPAKTQRSTPAPRNP